MGTHRLALFAISRSYANFALTEVLQIALSFSFAAFPISLASTARVRLDHQSGLRQD
jgi:hypothetical protein